MTCHAPLFHWPLARTANPLPAQPFKFLWTKCLEYKCKWISAGWLVRLCGWLASASSINSQPHGAETFLSEFYFSRIGRPCLVLWLPPGGHDAAAVGSLEGGLEGFGVRGGCPLRRVHKANALLLSFLYLSLPSPFTSLSTSLSLNVSCGYAEALTLDINCECRGSNVETNCHL